MDQFDIAETNDVSTGKAEDGLSHLIGSKDEDVRMLPDLSKKGNHVHSLPDLRSPYGHTHKISPLIDKESRRDFSEREKWALIEEDGEAHNARKIDVKGTHYENQSADEIAMLIMPLKGF